MVVSLPVACYYDLSTDVCAGTYSDVSKSTEEHSDGHIVQDDDDDKSSVVSAFEFWSDIDDSCSETEPPSFSMSSYSSLLGPSVNAGPTVRGKTMSGTLTHDGSWFDKNETKHGLTNDEIDLLIEDLKCDTFNSGESKLGKKKKSKPKNRENENKLKKKGNTKSSSAKKKMEKEVGHEKKARRKQGKTRTSKSVDMKHQDGEEMSTIVEPGVYLTSNDGDGFKEETTEMAQNESEVSLDLDDLTESIPCYPTVAQRLQQKSWSLPRVSVKTYRATPLYSHPQVRFFRLSWPGCETGCKRRRIFVSQ